MCRSPRRRHARSCAIAVRALRCARRRLGEDGGALSTADQARNRAKRCRARASIWLAARAAASRRVVSRPGTVDAAVAGARRLQHADSRPVALRSGHASRRRRRGCKRVQLRASVAPYAMNLRFALAVIAVALVAVAAGVYVSYWQKSAGPFERALAPKALPDLRFNDGAGRARSLADFRGKVVLLNVWATWCEPCREEMPALDRLQEKLGGERFQVIALSIDQQGAPIAQKFYSQVGIKRLPLYIDPTAKAAFVLDAPGLPATLLLDRKGREIGRHLGAVKWDAPE